ncbi:calcium-translocating P-type ATPase [Sedimentibacter acidaminivorans]|uniref:P-type Ca(2+) transporter n=1 Tax=Sedimentibacter acidaminivorans TaxID=913099 RepID=A0ABS4G9Y4_9FIRM|nr:calcium-translocating P-type ATPase, PMCA-type [Sedimentibacter acidaminivorans]MBP1924500.1 calcium-translocating P-type ATPase [Sedimentibacter acidaminivorans]
MHIVKNRTRSYKGLSTSDVEKSRQKFGANKITINKRKTFLNQYFESFGDPTIKILLVALGLNLIFFIKNFNWYESVGIAVSIILATFVSSISEYGSQLAFEKLMEDSQKIKCNVWRDNQLFELPIAEIVCGDFVQFQSGDKIPADGILIDGQVDVDQSTLNGETKEAHKYAANKIDSNDNNNTVLLDANSLFSGSVVCNGEGTMLVQRVGEKTFYGKLARELQEENHDSPLKQRLTVLARTISFFGYTGALLVLFSSLFKSIIIDNGFNTIEIANYLKNSYLLLGDILKAVTYAITIIVVAVPEGLPVMITVVLSSNMKRMIKDNVLVRKLVGIETAGSLNILFTDKTGTLTKGKLDVVTFIDGENNLYDDLYDLKENEELWKYIFVSSVFNNGAKSGYNGSEHIVIGGNSTDRALLNFALCYPVESENIVQVSSIPFNSNNKHSVTQVSGDVNLTLIKGATEKILPFCTKRYDKNGNICNLNTKKNIYQNIADMSSKGVRILALATSNKSLNECKSNKFSDLVLVGIVGIKDEVRPNAKSSVNEVLNAGVQVVMITGDSKETATSIALETGLINDVEKNQIITSSELSDLNDKQVKKLLPSIKVVARALPGDKSRLVRLSQSMGLVVGMTGDGVNDAPALKKADVGFSMGSGTEIAKEASDIVILDDNFLSIGKAILYGRTIFKSIRKFIIFQLSINVCAVIISLIGQFIGIDTPITVVQMLWVNMVMDTLAGLAFAGESPLPEYMEDKPKEKNEKIINKYMANQIFFTGLYTTILCILFLKLPHINHIFRYSSDNKYLMTGFFALFMFCSIFNSLNARTHRLNLLSHILRNKTFVIIMGLVSIIQIILLYFGGSVFRSYGLTTTELIVILSLSFTVIPFDLMRKSYLRLKYNKDEVSKFL